MTAAAGAPEVLLRHHLRKPKLPTVLRDNEKLTHHVHILEMNGPSHRLAQSRSRRRPD